MSLEDSKLRSSARFVYERAEPAAAQAPGTAREHGSAYEANRHQPPQEPGGTFEIPDKHGNVADAVQAAHAVAPRLPDPVAILVLHGMGEQVRYETIGGLAKSLLATSGNAGSTTISISHPNGTFLARAEIAFTDPAGTPRTVHIYEAYWAPITEGQVTYFETLKFLFGAAWTGIRRSRLGKACTFQRWMFGQPVTLPIAATTQRNLLLTFFVLAGLVVFILYFTLQMGVLLKSFSSGHVSWIDIGHLFAPYSATVQPAWVALLLSVVFWGGVAASVAARYFIIQYAGDVAAYISPFKASKFQGIRDAIQKVGFDVGSYIFGFTSAPVPAYGKVVLVGHSLGSVVAYDTLNALINLDIATGEKHGVVARTGSLITFGSPLDKTAFLFRNQPNTLTDPLREQMVAASQPLVLDYSFRRPGFRWTNIYAPADIISGSLDYYDDPADPASVGKTIVNLQDPDATTWLAAHVQYWDNALLTQVLLDSL